MLIYVHTIVCYTRKHKSMYFRIASDSHFWFAFCFTILLSLSTEAHYFHAIFCWNANSIANTLTHDVYMYIIFERWKKAQTAKTNFSYLLLNSNKIQINCKMLNFPIWETEQHYLRGRCGYYANAKWNSINKSVIMKCWVIISIIALLLIEIWEVFTTGESERECTSMHPKILYAQWK